MGERRFRHKSGSGAGNVEIDTDIQGLEDG